MYLIESMVDHALDAKFVEGSPHRKVFRYIVLSNPKVRTMTTVVKTGEWIASLTEEQVKSVTYDDFLKAVGDDGEYHSRS